MFSHIALTPKHLEEKITGCSLVGRKYLKSKNIAMVDLNTICIEVLCKKCHYVFLFVVMMILKIAT